MTSNASWTRVTGVACLLAAALLLIDVAPVHAALGPYFSAPFRAQANSYNFGQTPAWTVSGDVLSNEADGAGIEQVYVSRLNGSHRRCLTCGRLPGPNGFPEERPEGDWILFCSMGAQPEHYGNPCLGGYGSDLYVVRPNGSQLTRLTASSDPGGGARYDNRPNGIPYDNYHVYWSPDGRHLIWTRTEAYPLSEGGQRWEIMLADFLDPAHGRPHLANVRVVGPAYGVYETQAWAPDGSGFLFTAFGPRQSPYQSTPPGWMHLELYYMRLYGRGASPAHPLVTHLTDDDPAYEEQAVFTPNMRDVIVMTNRARPATWYETVISAAAYTGFDAPDPGSAGTPMFLADFSDPLFTSDLYMVDVSTGAVRQLTNFGHVIPEFGWNFDYTKLIWSEGVRSPNAHYITRVATFAGITSAQRRPPTAPAPGLYGQPIDMAWVAGALRLVRDVSGSRGASSLMPAVRSTGADPATIPPVAATYAVLLYQQLEELASLAASRIVQPTL